LGGHKHTYASTFPVRENYKYSLDGGSTYIDSKIQKMEMEETLENDNRVV
jgi:hypothetical protein